MQLKAVSAPVHFVASEKWEEVIVPLQVYARSIRNQLASAFLKAFS